MPKQFTLADKKKWLAHYENGKTELWIAREEAHCNVRTVKKGIEEACREHDARTARVELIKDALKKHQESLLAAIEEILSALKVPPPNLVLPWTWESRRSMPLEGARAEVRSGHAPVVTIVLTGESKAEWGLLEEHLKRDRIWKVLTQWKRTLAAHLEQRIAMQHRILALLEKKTGYELVDRSVTPPFVYRNNAARLLYETALHRVIEIPDDTNLEGRIVADTVTGEVTYGGAILAKAPGNEEQCKKNILHAFHELEASSEAIRVAQTYRAVEELTTKAKRAVEEISLLKLVPGRCRVCRRLGL